MNNPDPRPQKDRTLRDRVVVVTRASCGIGAAIAVCAGADGASVALLARTETPNPKVARALDLRPTILAEREEDITPNF